MASIETASSADQSLILRTGAADVMRAKLDDVGNLTLFGEGRVITPYTSAVGQCYVKAIGGNLVMQRDKGSMIMINGRVEQIPEAGVSLAPGVQAVGSYQHIYAYMDAGVMKLGKEPMATGRAIDSFGQQVIAGHPEWTLVAKAYNGVANSWAPGIAGQVNLINWFNRRKVHGYGYYGAVRNWSTGSWAELDSAGRVYFLHWGPADGENVDFLIGGSLQNNTATALSQTGVALNNTSNPDICTQALSIPNANGYNHVTMGRPINGAQMVDGMNYLAQLCWANSGTGSWNLNIQAEVMG